MDLWRRTWDGVPALRMQADNLSEDEWGHWLLLPAGTMRFLPTARGWEPFFAMMVPTIAVVGSGNRWVASFTPAWWKVDLTSPVQLRGDGADWCDLFLDVECPPGGPAQVVDEDEFEASLVTANEKALTRETARWVAEAIDGASGPFGSAFLDRCDSLRGTWDGPTAQGVILTLQTWDERAVAESFGRDLLDPWRARQTGGEGYVLVAMTSGDVVGLGWKPHATGGPPGPQVIAVADRVRGTGLARELERAVQGLGPWAEGLTPPL